MDFSVVVAAAGLGKRMNSHLPKALIQVGDKTLIEIVLNNFHAKASKIIFVINESQESVFRLMLPADLLEKSIFVNQPTPTGTFDAALLGLNQSESPLTFILWGDHIGASIMPVEKLLQNVTLTKADILIPIIRKNDPYVYFELDKDMKVTAFHETKYGSPRIANGYSDAGVFLVRTNEVRRWFSHLLITRDGTELNLLAVFPSKHSRNLDVKVVEFKNVLLTLGANTPDELSRAWSQLQNAPIAQFEECSPE